MSYEIIKQKIEPNTDLLEHFVKYLPILQDWERIMVWKIDKRAKAFLSYCYKRKEDKENTWEKCEPKNSSCSLCKIDGGKSYFDELKVWVENEERKHLSSDEADFRIKNSKRKVFLEKILTQRFIPELYKEDEVRYENFRLIYEYPPYTIFPEDESNSHTLGLYYERQQIDLLRQLAIKRKVMMETKRHGTRAAVAAIMGRNMSHNIGSHVLSRLSEYKDNELETGTKKSKALFIYLQRRMDFIAQISTTSPSWTVDIKWGEILEDFKEQTYLLDNIAKFKNLDSKSIKITYENNDKDKYVAIPTGLVGCHAFYSILENVIRNSAKYGYVKDGLEFNILLKDYDNEYFEVCITDNCKNANYKLVDNLNNMFKENLIDNEGGLSGTFWGIKEEKISSSYLRLIAAENIDYQFEESLKAKPIIEVVTENCNIQYNILLIKPRKALIISENIPSDKETYKDYGIDFLSDIGDLKSYVSTKKVNHKFLVLPQKINTGDKDWLRENCNYLPIRSIKLDLSKNNSPDDLYNKIWEKYFQDLNKEILNQKIVVRWGDDGGFNESIKKNLNDSSFIHIWHTINVVDFDNFILFDHKSDNNETGLCSKASLRVPFDSADALGYLLQSDLTQLKFLRYEFLESFNTKVAIVDNRVWEECSKQISIKKCNNVAIIKDVWKKMGVEFFDHNEAITDFKDFVEKREQGYKYLIFHQGEIDEIKKNIKNDFWQNWKKLCKKFDHVIIDTGRGVPDQAKKDNLRWVQYSSIQDCIINQIKNNIGIAKYNLIKLLSSLKRD